MQCFACRYVIIGSFTLLLSVNPSFSAVLEALFLTRLPAGWLQACRTLSCHGVSCISRRVLQTYSMMQIESLLLKMHRLLSCRLMHMRLAVLSPLKLNGWLGLFLMSTSTPLQQGSSGACCILIQLADPPCSRHLMMTFCSLKWSVCLLLLLAWVPWCSFWQ